MKVGYTTKSSNSAKSSKPRVVPPIPFERANADNVSKDKLSSFKLRSDPSDASSPTYELSVRYFNDGTPEEWLLFLKAVREVLRGQGITTGPPAFNMYRRLLKLSLIHI